MQTLTRSQQNYTCPFTCLPSYPSCWISQGHGSVLSSDPWHSAHTQWARKKSAPRNLGKVGSNSGLENFNSFHQAPLSIRLSGFKSWLHHFLPV